MMISIWTTLIVTFILEMNVIIFLNTEHITFSEYFLVHNIQQSKLFVVQTILQIAELQKY